MRPKQPVDWPWEFTAWRRQGLYLSVAVDHLFGTGPRNVSRDVGLELGWFMEVEQDPLADPGRSNLNAYGEVSPSALTSSGTWGQLLDQLRHTT